MFNCFEICRNDPGGDWMTYHVSFVNEDDCNSYIGGAAFESFDESRCRHEIVSAPDGQVREQNPISSHSESDAIGVAQSALANPHSTVHDRERLDASTPIFVLDESSGTRTKIQ